MSEPGAHELTELLMAWGNGDEEALARITPLVHAELYRLAKSYMNRERPDHLLQTSALINEAYLRLIDWKAVRWQNRAHFFGVAAQMMRRILFTTISAASNSVSKESSNEQASPNARVQKSLGLPPAITESINWLKNRRLC